MNDEQAKRADHALRLYGEWLTMWMRRGPVPDNDTAEITASSFSYVIHHDTIDDEEVGSFQGLRSIILTCDYGDDGGGTDLMCFFDQSKWDGDWDVLVHILQGYDTSFTWIYKDQNFDHTPEAVLDNLRKEVEA